VDSLFAKIASPRPGGARAQVIEHEASEIESSSSATTEKDLMTKKLEGKTAETIPSTRTLQR